MPMPFRPDHSPAPAALAAARRGENFPVASLALGRRQRAAVVAFYRFARTADDIADDPARSPADKLSALDALEAALSGNPAPDAAEVAPDLARVLAERGLDARHPRDLLTAFRRDAENRGADDWDGLMDYCRYSAAPVGRFLLDLFGESRRLYPPADALCAALQVLNHIQDIAADHRDLDRRYIPLAWPGLSPATAADLEAAAASPAVSGAIARTLDGVDGLLAAAEPLIRRMLSPRLRVEAAAILALARRLAAALRLGDPVAARIAPSGRDKALALIKALPQACRPPEPLLSPALAAPVSRIVEESGSSFTLALRCLPRPRRQAMFALYALCRVLDDIADDAGLDAGERMSRLNSWRQIVDILASGAPLPPDAPDLARALAAVEARFGLDAAECRAVIDGMAMDVTGPIRAPSLAELSLYCRRVAGAVGLLSLPLLGAEDARSRAFALALGEALQLTNILRDVAADARDGRGYVPAEILAGCGIPGDDPRTLLTHPRRGEALARLAVMAKESFARARAALTVHNRPALLAPRMMMAVYENLLARLERRGWDDLSPLPGSPAVAKLFTIARARLCQRPGP